MESPCYIFAKVKIRLHSRVTLQGLDNIGYKFLMSVSNKLKPCPFKRKNNSNNLDNNNTLLLLFNSHTLGKKGINIFYSGGQYFSKYFLKILKILKMFSMPRKFFSDSLKTFTKFSQFSQNYFSNFFEISLIDMP